MSDRDSLRMVITWKLDAFFALSDGVHPLADTLQYLAASDLAASCRSLRRARLTSRSPDRAAKLTPPTSQAP